MTRERLRMLEIDKVLAKHARKQKYAKMTHEIRSAQNRAHIRNELDRIEGVLYHRVASGLQRDVLFEQKRVQLQQALKESLFDRAGSSAL